MLVVLLPSSVVTVTTHSPSVTPVTVQDNPLGDIVAFALLTDQVTFLLLALFGDIAAVRFILLPTLTELAPLKDIDVTFTMLSFLKFVANILSK